MNIQKIAKHFFLAVFALLSFAANSATFDTFTATKGSEQGFVRLKWSMPTITCPSAYGCGYRIKRNGSYVFSSTINTNGAVWDPVLTFDDFNARDNITYTYSIEGTYDTYSGAGTVYGGQVGTSESDTGYAGDLLQNVTLTGVPGGVKIKWSPAGFQCKQPTGCGYQIKIDTVTTVYTSQIDVDAKTLDPLTEFIVPVSDTKTHDFWITAFLDGTPGVGTTVGGWLGFPKTYQGTGLASIDRFQASKGTFPGQVKLDWNPIEMACPSNDGCGFEIEQDGVSVYKSLTPTFPTGYSARGKVWVGGNEFRQLVTDTATHSYKIKLFSVTRTGSTTSGTSAYIGTTEVDSGFAGSAITNLQVSKGTYKASVVVKVDSVTGKIACPSDYGCGYEYSRDGSIINQSLNLIGTTQPGKVWGSGDLYVDYAIQDTKVHEYKVKLYAKELVSGTTFKAKYIGEEASDTGWALPNLSEFTASKGEFPTKVSLSWKAENCGNQPGCGVQITRDGTVIKTSQIGYNGYSFVEGTQFVQGGTFDDTPGPGIHQYKIVAFWGVKSGSNTVMGPLVGEPIYATGYTSGSNLSINNFTASDGEFVGAVKLKWDALADADEIRLFEKTDSGENQIIALPGTATNYELTYDDSASRRYLAKGYKAGVLIGSGSAIDAGFAKPAFTSFKATDGTLFTKIQIDWNQVEGATQYELLKFDGTTWSQIYIGPNLTFTENTAETKSSYYRIRAMKDGVYFGGISAVESGFARVAVENVDASDGTFPGKVYIAWDAVEGATRYYVIRDGSIIEAVNKNSFMDATLSDTLQHAYSIRALDSANKQIGTDSAINYGYAGMFFTKFTASKGTVYGAVELEWNAVEGAAYYIVFKANGSYANVTTTKYRDTNLVGTQSYLYYVQAYRSNGMLLERSASTTGFAAGTTATPKNVKASDGTSFDSIRITWDAVQFCTVEPCDFSTQSPNPTNTTVQNYKIWRDGEELAVVNGTTVTYLDSGTTVKGGKSFNYWVEALSPTNAVINSRSGSDPGYTLADIAAPKNVTASDGLKGKVVINWTRSIGATGYAVFRDGVLINIVMNPAVSYTDTTGVPGQSYSYQIAGMSEDSMFAKSTADTGYSLLDAVTNLSATQGTVTELIRVSWDKKNNATSYLLFIDNSVSKVIGLTNGFDAATNRYTYTFNDIENVNPHTFYVIPRIGTSQGEKSATVTGYANYPAESVSATGSAFNGVEIEMTPVVVDPNKNESFTFTVPTQPSNGTASVRNGKIVYKSNALFSGEEVFNIVVTDKGNEDTTGQAKVKVSCVAPILTLGNVTPANLKSYNPGSIDVTITANGCVSNYKVDYEFQSRNSSGAWETFTGSSFASVAGGEVKKLDFDSLVAGNYQVKVTATDLNSTTAPVVKLASFEVKPYALPTLAISKKLVMQSTEEVVATVAEPTVKDCVFTYSGSQMNTNPFTYCLIQWQTVPVGMNVSTDRTKISGVIDSYGTKNISATISIQSPKMGRVIIGTIIDKVEVTALSEMRFSAPESLDVVQYLTKSQFIVKKGSENTCEVTTNVESAMNSFGDKNFRCLLEMTNMPTSLEKTGDGFRGYFTEEGTSTIGWTISYFKHGTEKLLVKSGSVAVNVTPAEIDYDLEKLVDRPLQLITSVNLGLKKVGKNACPLTTWNDADVPGKCLVEWLELPSGIEQNSDVNFPKLEGVFNNKGVQTVRFALSFVDSLGVKTLIQEKQVSFDVEEAPQPRISFADGNIISDDILGYPKQGGIASRLVVDATRASVDGDVSFTQNASNDFRFAVKGGKRSRVLLIRAAPLWSEQSATVKLWMKDNTTLAAAKKVTLVSIPDLKVRPELMIVNNTYGDEGPAKIKMRIGEYRKGGFAYLPEEMGTWKLRLLQRVNGVFVPASDFKTVSEVGETEVQLPVVGLAVARLMVEAMAVSPSNPLVEVKRLSRYRDIRIVKGKPIDGSLTIKSDRPSAGAAPFNVRFEIKLDGKADVAALGAFNLELSKDGSDWVANEDKKCRLLCNIMFYEGKYQVRAHFVNKNSGAESYSEPLDIYAYDAIKMKMEGANVFYPNDRVDLVIKTTNSQGQDTAANIEWEVTSGSSRDPSSSIASGTGDRVSFTHNKSGTLYVTAKAVRTDIDDPTLKDYVMSKFTVLYKPIRKPKVVVIGPKVAETDVVQTFNAQVITDFDGTNTKLKATGEWTLPDGQKVPGNVLNWMPDASDKDFANMGKINLTYSAWVEGFKEETLVSISRPLALWTYIWPDFTMKATLTKNVAPTTATLVVTPDDKDAFAKISSKDITYTWNIDPELILNRVTGGTAKMTIPMGGTFMAGVTISDKRGNSTSLEVPMSSNDISDIFVKMNIANASKHSHAPLDISVNTQVTGGANGDFVKDIAYDLDGAPLDFGNKSFGKVLSIPRGNHNINVKVTTNYGKVGTQTANFEVKDNVPPVCELKITPIDNRDAYLEVSCTDPDGRIKLYDWTVDSVNIGARSFRWKYRKSSDKANIPVSVEITDSGDAKVRVNGIVP